MHPFIYQLKHSISYLQMKYCTFYLQGQTLTETWKVESDISKSGKFSCKRVAGKSGKSGKKSLGDTANHINPHTTRWVKQHYSLFVQQIESSRSINISDSLSLTHSPRQKKCSHFFVKFHTVVVISKRMNHIRTDF